MNILLTNDDGYNAKGILLVKEKLKKYGRVIIVAPEKQMSAKSVSITLAKGMRFIKQDNDVYSLDGTPADCVSFALHALDIKFDLVVSGCNDGYNVSTDTNYSGTVGACVQANKYHYPAVALSADTSLKNVEECLERIMDFIFKHNLLSRDYSININIPHTDEIKGIRFAKLYYHPEQFHYYFTKDEDGYIAHRTLLSDYEDDIESDNYLLKHGYITITPMQRYYFNEKIYKKWLKL